MRQLPGQGIPAPELVAGIIDWGTSGTGPPDIDIGHCRLNLAILFGADWAERFLRAYEAEAGRAVDPWWDLHAIASYDDGWPRFVPVQCTGGSLSTAPE